MTIIRSRGEIEFHCDGSDCHETLEAETRDFDEALEFFRDSTWRFRRGGSEYLHICPDCVTAELGATNLAKGVEP